KSLGVNVQAVASIVDRSNGKVDFGVKFVNLISMDIASYDECDCPMCKNGMEIVKPGSRVFSK
ncbi:MAG: orotate phosphoribosyltransferase, partial [Clostridia bacterium]